MKLSVTNAVWLATALLTYEKFKTRTVKSISDMLAGTAWSFALQDRKYHLFERQFALRPDIVLRNEDKGRVIVLDTKWKVLVNDPSKNYGISQADIYQMYAYAKKYQTNEILAIYLKVETFRDYGEIQFVSDDGVKVSVGLWIVMKLRIVCQN